MSRLIIKINIKIIEPKIVDKVCISKKPVSASERKTKYSANYDKSLDFDKKYHCNRIFITDRIYNFVRLFFTVHRHATRKRDSNDVNNWSGGIKTRVPFLLWCSCSTKYSQVFILKFTRS